MPAYKERFIKEYNELRERYGKLLDMLDAYDNGTLDFTPSCDIGLLRAQSSAMETYLEILRLRASQESIDI